MGLNFIDTSTWHVMETDIILEPHTRVTYSAHGARANKIAFTLKDHHTDPDEQQGPLGQLDIRATPTEFRRLIGDLEGIYKQWWLDYGQFVEHHGWAAGDGVS